MSNDFERTARELELPIPFKVYKGVKGNFGAMRINFKQPYTNSDPKKKEGVIFVEMVPAIGPNVYDWENQKITMALSLADIPKIILYLRSPKHPDFKKGKLQLIHDRGAGTHTKGEHITTLEVVKPDDKNSYFFKMYQNINGTTTQATVPISAAEAIVIGTLLQTAISKILSWT